MVLTNVFTPTKRDVSNGNETYTLYIDKGGSLDWVLVQTTHNTGVYTHKFLTGTGQTAMDNAWTNRAGETYSDDIPEGLILPGLIDFFSGGS